MDEPAPRRWSAWPANVPADIFRLVDHQADSLILELLTWISCGRRTYGETMEAWRTSCPRHSVWEDALIAGLIRIEGEANEVVLTPQGRALLNGASSGAG